MIKVVVVLKADYAPIEFESVKSGSTSTYFVDWVAPDGTNFTFRHSNILYYTEKRV